MPCLITRIHDATHAHESGVAESLVPEASVLSRPHVHHSSSEVLLLIHESVAIHHIAGLAVRHVVAIHDGVTVIIQLHTLTTEALPLVNLHSVRSSVLYGVDIKVH